MDCHLMDMLIVRNVFNELNLVERKALQEHLKSCELCQVKHSALEESLYAFFNEREENYGGRKSI